MEHTSITLRSERILSATGLVSGELRIADGRIEGISSRVRSTDSDTVDLGPRWIVPGFIDTHVHGGGGAQLHTTDSAEIDVACRFHAAHGTTALLATTVPDPIPELRAVLAAIAGAHARPTGGAAVLGAHLEGPFINPARPGALDAGCFIAPDPAALADLLEAARGAVRMVTLAPELPGALDLVADLVTRGVVVSLGHTDATYAQVAAGVAAGARSATHLFNGMRGFHHREPGPAGAALDLAQLNAELIADGEHVSSPALRVVLRAKGIDGVRLITDAIAATGMPEGTHLLGASAVQVVGGRVTIPGTETLAGSVLTMDAAVRRAVAELDLPIQQAVALASANPARVLGMADRKGALAPGMDADIVVLDEDLGVCATLVAGEWVHGTSGGQ